VNNAFFLEQVVGDNAVQDPSYPVYVDTTVMSGNTGEYNPDTSGFDGLQYMICNPDNDFFPDLSKIGKTGVTLQLLRYPIVYS
jgi:hypothetical protein